MWSRRRLLATGGLAAALLAAPRSQALAGSESNRPEVLARSAWAGTAAPAGPVADEPEVRFLLVHHTVNANDYTPDAVPDLLRRIHAFHTGPDKAWPDIAYNFIVDRFGRAWETRSGSLDRPVAGDATGGNQGWDQKCAFLGDHRTDEPTPAAIEAMASLLAFLADRSGIDTRPGATTAFESRGSNRHPAGTVVTTATIAGHRSMSQTACPGDAGTIVVRDHLPGLVTARRRSTAPAAPSPAPSTTTPPTPPATPPTIMAPATTAQPPATSAPTTAPPALSSPTTPNGSGTAPTAGSPPAGSFAAPVAGPAGSLADPRPWPVVGAAGGAVAVVVGGLIVWRERTQGH